MAQSTSILDFTIASSTSRATDTLVGQVTITVGGTTAGDPGTNQFVKIDAILSYEYDAGTPPFQVQFYLAEGDQTITASRSITLDAGIRDTNTLVEEVVSLSWVRPAAPGVHTYKLYVFTTTTGTGAAPVDMILTATAHAFGSTGLDTLEVEAAPAEESASDDE